jgi:hypothetical protein
MQNLCKMLIAFLLHYGRDTPQTQANCIKRDIDPMTSDLFPRILRAGCLLFPLSFASLSAQDTSTESAAMGEETFEYHVGKVNYLTGEGVNIGGFLFPSIYATVGGAMLEPGASAEEFATSEHDPLNERGIQAIEAHLGINFNDVVTGAVTGFGHQGEAEIWEAELEEAYLHWHVTDFLAIGGGQFLNRFGFQSDLHLHDWLFVNQNLGNSRMLNEGELITQGGEILLETPHSGLFTLGFGGVRSHAHEEDPGPFPPDFVHADEAEFTDMVLTSDYRFRLPIDDSITASASLAFGDNGFIRDTWVYGLGLRKVWNGHDHGYGGPDFCSGAFMLQTEYIGRSVDGFNEGGDAVEFEDDGFTTSLHYGLTDNTTLSLRHDWISEVEIAELTERNRVSAALTTFVDPAQRVKARLQYDHVQDDGLESEHVAWLQIQFQWGGTGGSHAGHGH